MSNGRKKNARTKRTVNRTGKKGSGNNAKKAKGKKTNTRHAGNISAVQRKKVSEKEAQLIYDDLLKASGRREKFTTAKQKEKADVKKRKEIAKRFDIPLKRVQTNNIYDAADSYEKIKSIVKKEKRLRYNGKFISNEAQEQILKFSQILSSKGVEFTLSELLTFPEIEKKILVIKNTKIPKHLFYWNLQNKIHDNSFGTPIIIIKDYDGKEVFNNTSRRREIEGIYKDEKTHKAVQILNGLNKKLENLETLIEEAEDLTPYFTVATFDYTRDGEVIKIIIDYSGTESRLPEDVFRKYRQLL